MEDGQKTCSKCGMTRLLERFNYDRTRPDGRFPWCKDCSRENDRTRYSREVERRAEWARGYYQAHRERVLQRVKTRYEVIGGREIYRRRYAATREHMLETSRRREILKRAVEGDGHTRQEVYDRDDGLCWICGAGPLVTWHEDHLAPLSVGGPHVIWNVATACVSCNIRKSNRNGADFL